MFGKGSDLEIFSFVLYMNEGDERAGSEDGPLGSDIGPQG